MVRNLEQELQEYEDLTGQSSGKGYQQKSPVMTLNLGMKLWGMA